ncbi:MAG TPA: ABC transporter ATP-binding protein [Gemmatimonadaceae bacterium]|jgi:ABC-2 type transport system ATP-binding protein
MTTPAIQTEDLVRDFGPVRALDHLTLVVPAGIVFGFLGPNGAGKTTAIRAFLGLVEPTGGLVRVLGFDIRRESDRIRERSGALLEHHGLYERLTAEQNLDLAGRIWRMPRPQRRARTRELLEQFGLWDRRAEPAGHWSRGMKQKLAVARAVYHRPPLVFLDEPTAGLDPVASAALRDDLASLAVGQGVTVFLTTHNLVEAERLCALVGVIRRGRLVAMGPPGSLLQENSAIVRISGSGLDEPTAQGALSLPGVIAAALDRGELVVRLAPGATSAALVAMLVQRGVGVEEVRRERRTLEEAFLELVGEDSAGARSPSGGAMPGDGRAG